jgi:transcriptional regulator
MAEPEKCMAPPELAKELISSICFGELVTVGPDRRAYTSHLVFEATDDGGADQLIFHIPRLPKWHSQLTNLERGEEAVASFTGANGYISPTWDDPERAPTWDFETVEVRGVAQPLSQTALREHLRSLIARHEARLVIDSSFSLDSLPKDYLEKHVSSLAGFSIPMEDVAVRQKLSQDRDPETIQRIARGVLVSETLQDDNSLSVRILKASGLTLGID